jgi:hypothetical protein
VESTSGPDARFPARVRSAPGAMDFPGRLRCGAARARRSSLLASDVCLVCRYRGGLRDRVHSVATPPGRHGAGFTSRRDLADRRGGLDHSRHCHGLCTDRRGRGHFAAGLGGRERCTLLDGRPQRCGHADSTAAALAASRQSAAGHARVTCVACDASRRAARNHLAGLRPAQHGRAAVLLSAVRACNLDRAALGPAGSLAGDAHDPARYRGRCPVPRGHDAAGRSAVPDGDTRYHRLGPGRGFDRAGGGATARRGARGGAARPAFCRSRCRDLGG